MATTLSPPAVSPPTEAALPPDPGPEPPRVLGLPSATALVIGSIIGTGVFTMPAVMAGAGTSSILTLGVIAVGAVLLGVMFGQLTKRVPHNEGGLYAYARHEFGDFAGYLTAWCYWITCWAGNAAIVASLGPLRRGAVRHRQPVGLDQLRHRPHRPLDPGGHQPRRRPPDGVVPERHRRAEVPAPARSWPSFGWFFVEHRQLRAVQRLRRQPLRRRQPRRRRGPVLLHRRRVRLDRRRPGRRTPAATSAGRRSSAPPPAALLYVAVTAAVMGLVPHDAAGRRRRAVRRRLRRHVRRRLDRQARRPRPPSSPASAP